MLGLVESDIVKSFREGGGVPYARFPDFQHVMAEGSGAVHDAALIDGISRWWTGWSTVCRRGSPWPTSGVVRGTPST